MVQMNKWGIDGCQQNTETILAWLRDSQWQWVYRNLRRRKLCGLCDYDGKKVSICKTLNGFDRLDTELHEALHACQGFASEDHVAETATTLATILWRLGYRLPGEHDGSDHKGA
jgi:hypothetical protein